MNTLKAILLAIFTFLITNQSVVHADSCSYTKTNSCSAGQSGCGNKDYLEATDAEIAILGKESFHANIAMIEKALKEKGVSLPENGYITSEFRSALVAFQESAGLQASGEINQATLDKLSVKF